VLHNPNAASGRGAIAKFHIKRDTTQAEQYRLAMTAGPGFGFLTLGDDAALLAARFRLRYKLKLPDAFQLAACVLSGCDALATHDRDFRHVREVKIIDVA
jgi:predicted nucleic acid-binding protein